MTNSTQIQTELVQRYIDGSRVDQIPIATLLSQIDLVKQIDQDPEIQPRISRNQIISQGDLREIFGYNKPESKETLFERLLPGKHNLIELKNDPSSLKLLTDLLSGISYILFKLQNPLPGNMFSEEQEEIIKNLASIIDLQTGNICPLAFEIGVIIKKFRPDYITNPILQYKSVNNIVERNQTQNATRIMQLRSKLQSNGALLDEEIFSHLPKSDLSTQAVFVFRQALIAEFKRSEFKHSLTDKAETIPTSLAFAVGTLCEWLGYTNGHQTLNLIGLPLILLAMLKSTKLIESYKRGSHEKGVVEALLSSQVKSFNDAVTIREILSQEI